MPDLTGPNLKLRRANQHLNSLKKRIDRFLKTNPYSFSIEPHPNPPSDCPRAHALIAHIHRYPSDDWGIVAGDIAHNLRSSLDLLVNALSTLPARARKRRKLQFPICDSTGLYKQAINRGQLTGVDAAHVALIKTCQPYERCKLTGATVTHDFFGMLREINDADKHRRIQVVGAIPKYEGMKMRIEGSPAVFIAGGGAGLTLGRSESPGFSYRVVRDRTITKDRTIVAILDNRMKRKVYVEAHPKPLIEFGKACSRVKGRHVVDTLTAIRDRVKEVFGYFK